MLKITITRNQWLLLLTVVAVSINTIIHFRSPAYKYYRESISQMREDLNSFKDSVKQDFLPAVYLLATNGPQIISSSPIANVAPIRDPNGSLGNLDGEYFEVQGNRGFVFDRKIFFVGDDFFGYPILGITKTLVTTAQGNFYLSKSPFYTKETRKEESHE